MTGKTIFGSLAQAGFHLRGKKRMRALPSALLIVSLLSLSCGRSPLEVKVGEITARATATHVLLANGTNERIYFIIMGAEAQHYIDWSFHYDQRFSVASFDFKRIEMKYVSLHGQEKTLIVRWWHYPNDEPGASSARAGKIEVPL